MKPTPITITPIPGLLRAQAALLIAQELYWARGNEENKRLVERAELQLKRVESQRARRGKWVV
jgi:hypothetical protein